MARKRRARPRWLAPALSIPLVFHLLAIAIAPNIQSSTLGLRLNRLFGPYIRAFALIPSWNFFAPDPGPPPVSLEWDLIDKAGSTVRQGTFPDPHANYFFGERQNRRIAAVRFMAAFDQRAEKMMVTYLCKKYPSAVSVRLWRKVVPVPSLQEVQSGARTIGDEIGEQRTAIAYSFCGSLE